MYENAFRTNKMSEIFLTKKVHGVKLRDIKARALRKISFEALFLFSKITAGICHWQFPADA